MTFGCLYDLSQAYWLSPAPVFPTRRLVITGRYRYVRNPMYIAIVAVIGGRGLLFGHVRVLEYGVLV